MISISTANAVGSWDVRRASCSSSALQPCSDVIVATVRCRLPLADRPASTQSCATLTACYIHGQDNASVISAAVATCLHGRWHAHCAGPAVPSSLFAYWLPSRGCICRQAVTSILQHMTLHWRHCLGQAGVVYAQGLCGNRPRCNWLCLSASVSFCRSNQKHQRQRCRLSDTPEVPAGASAGPVRAARWQRSLVMPACMQAAPSFHARVCNMQGQEQHMLGIRLISALAVIRLG